MDSRRASDVSTLQANSSNTVIAAASSTSQITSSSSKKKKSKKNTSPGVQPAVRAEAAKVKTKVLHTTVGLLMARSPWLRKDNVYLGVLQKHSVSRSE